MFSPFVALWLWLDDSSRDLIKCYFRRLALGCFCLLVEPTSPSLLDHRWLKRACCEVPVNFSIYESKSLFPDGSRNQPIGRCRWHQNDPVAELIITMNPLYILNCPNRWLIAEITFLLDLLQCEHFQSSCACCLKKSSSVFELNHFYIRFQTGDILG